MSERNIYQRINAVMQKVTYVRKDKAVSAGGGGNYNAVTHDNVVAIARAEMVAQGIVIAPEQKSGVLNPPKEGSKMSLYEGNYIIHFVNMDKPDDRISVSVAAHANDNGDKAPGKALTYATKMAVLKVLWLETGDDEESRTEGMFDAEGVVDEVTAISNCNTLEDLQKAFASAWKATTNKTARAALTTAKDKRKAELLAGEAA